MCHKLQLGSLVECVGTIKEVSPPSERIYTRRWLNALHIYEIHDRNVETLRMLEVIYLYKTDYAVQGSSPPGNFELLAFPPITESSTTLMTEMDSEVTKHRVNGHQSNESGASSTLIEKPWERQRVGDLHLDVGIPPADYHFAVPEQDQVSIEQGQKSLEIRLNVAPYSIIHVNDRITVNDKTPTVVVAVRKYSRLQSVLEAENMNALLPQCSFLKAGTVDATAAAERHYRQFFSAEEEKRYGLVVFQLAVPLLSFSAPKSQEAWSSLVLQQLEARNDVGCSVADLRFAFPTLPVDQIMDILANLQFDALVVQVSDKYRLV
ncbi:unnamed protein product [Peronospora belbahrii]|uniref:Uncharacterized protein n=1 Tax=Peronospora belbahrii TaxID=622444 RepID=A0AAU9KPY2_9STRA|nr:unnamed protein product [Peronospora belbahrii]